MQVATSSSKSGACPVREESEPQTCTYQKHLFHPVLPACWSDPNSTCQTDHGPQAGSSRTHAAICPPNKKRKAEPDGWSPDSTLPAKHPARDGLRSKPRMYVGFMPEKKYDPVD